MRAIAAEVGAPEDAIEPSLRAILEGIGAHAGAVCLYDPQKLLLRLVAEVALSDNGCRSLRNIRQGVTSAWDMPLQSLLSQRAFLIDNPAENRYVPALVDDQKAVQTIACLPLYDGPNPVGSLVLVAMKPSTFGNEHIQALREPQRELVTMIEALRKRAGQTRASTPEPPPVAIAPANGTGTVPQTTTTPTPPDGREPSAEVQRLLVQLAESRTAAAAHEQAAAAAKRARDEQTVEIGRLRAELAEAKTALVAAADQSAAALRRQASEREGDLAGLQVELSRIEAAAAARERNLATEIERLRARLGAAESTATTREQELLTTWQSERESLKAEIESLRTGLTEANAATGRAQEVASASQRDCAAVSAELERERARAAALESDAASHRHDHATELERLRASLADVDDGRSRDGARIAELEQRIAELTERVAVGTTREGSLGAEMAARLGAAEAQESALRAEIETVARTVGEREAELAEARRLAAQSERALAETRAEADTARATLLAETAARIEAMRATIERLEARQDAAASSETARPQAVERTSAAVPAELPGDQPPASAPEPAAIAPAGALRLEERDGAEAAQGVADGFVTIETIGAPATDTFAGNLVSGDERFTIIDAEASWQGIQLDTQRVAIVTPQAAASLADGLPREPILVNLAAPGATAAVTSLRAAGLSTRFVAYIAAAGTGKALRLGTTEVIGGPMDPEVVLAVLEAYVTRGTRVLTAGADADAVMSLRQALSRQGVSVSMAWDANQAKDLLAMTKPAVAVIDLDLPPRDGYSLVAALADLTPVPVAVLVSQTADGAARFAAEAADRSRAARLIALQKLLSDLRSDSGTG